MPQVPKSTWGINLYQKKNVVDQSLINAVKKRNQNAFKKMYECCIRYVYSIVKRYVSNESDHQDVIQEIFARIYLSIDTFDEGKGEFKYWLRRITINECIKYYYKQKSPVKIVPIDSEATTQLNLSEEKIWLSKDEIMQYLNRMPDGYKQIFMLVVIDEYSHQDVSEILNISPETSRSQLHRAKTWLRENLSSNNLKLLAGGISF